MIIDLSSSTNSSGTVASTCFVYPIKKESFNTGSVGNNDIIIHVVMFNASGQRPFFFVVGYLFRRVRCVKPIFSRFLKFLFLCCIFTPRWITKPIETCFVCRRSSNGTGDNTFLIFYIYAFCLIVSM